MKKKENKQKLSPDEHLAVIEELRRRANSKAYRFKDSLRRLSTEDLEELL